MIYLNDADGRKPKLLDGVRVTENPKDLQHYVQRFVAESWSVEPENIFFAQNISTHIADVIELVSHREKIHSVLLDETEVRYYLDQFKYGRLLVDDMTYPNYAPKHSKKFQPQKVQVFNPYTIENNLKNILQPDKIQVIILSHVSRLDGVVFPVKRIYQAIKEIAPQSIIIIDGAQVLGAMRVSVEDFADVYVGVTSKFLGAEPHLGIAYLSPQFKQKYLSHSHYPTFNPEVYIKELYSTHLAIQTIQRNHEEHIQQLKTYALKKLKEKDIPVYLPPNQVPHFLSIPIRNKKETLITVKKLQENGITILHNLIWSIKEPENPLLRVSLSARTTEEDIDIFTKKFAEIKTEFT